MNNHCDVLIIGSGFGGSVAASRLADTGMSITVLERGPWRDTKAARNMGIGERSSLPYEWSFYSHMLRSMATGRLGKYYAERTRLVGSIPESRRLGCLQLRSGWW